MIGRRVSNQCIAQDCAHCEGVAMRDVCLCSCHDQEFDGAIVAPV